MEKLPYELLSLITLQVCKDGGKTVCCLRQVSQYISAAVERYRFYSVALHGRKQITGFWKSYQAAPKYVKENIRHLFLSDAKKGSETGSRVSEAFAGALRGLLIAVSQYLRTLTYLVYNYRQEEPYNVLMKHVFPLLTHLTIRDASLSWRASRRRKTCAVQNLEEALPTTPRLSHFHQAHTYLPNRVATEFRILSNIGWRTPGDTLRSVHLSGLHLATTVLVYIQEYLGCVPPSTSPYVNDRRGRLPSGVQRLTLQPAIQDGQYEHLVTMHNNEKKKLRDLQTEREGQDGTQFILLPDAPPWTQAQFREEWLQMQNDYVYN